MNSSREDSSGKRTNERANEYQQMGRQQKYKGNVTNSNVVEKESRRQKKNWSIYVYIWNAEENEK